MPKGKGAQYKKQNPARPHQLPAVAPKCPHGLRVPISCIPLPPGSAAPPRAIATGMQVWEGRFETQERENEVVSTSTQQALPPKSPLTTKYNPQLSRPSHNVPTHIKLGKLTHGDKISFNTRLGDLQWEVISLHPSQPISTEAGFISAHNELSAAWGINSVRYPTDNHGLLQLPDPIAQEYSRAAQDPQAPSVLQQRVWVSPPQAPITSYPPTLSITGRIWSPDTSSRSIPRWLQHSYPPNTGAIWGISPPAPKAPGVMVQPPSEQGGDSRVYFPGHQHSCERGAAAEVRRRRLINVVLRRIPRCRCAAC